MLGRVMLNLNLRSLYKHFKTTHHSSYIPVHKEERAQRSSLIAPHTMNRVKTTTWEQM